MSQSMYGTFLTGPSPASRSPYPYAPINVGAMVVNTSLEGVIFSKVTSPSWYWAEGEEPFAKYGFGGLRLMWKPGNGLWVQRLTEASVTTDPLVLVVQSEAKLDNATLNAATTIEHIQFLGWGLGFSSSGVQLTTKNTIVVYVKLAALANPLRWYVSSTELVSF